MAQQQKQARPADAWASQAVATFGDGPIDVGVDYLKGDPSKVHGVPDHLVECWAPEGEDLSDRGYFKADPQPEHAWAHRQQILWLTRRDMLERRRQLEREMFEKRAATADQPSEKIASEGGTLIRRKGKDDSIGSDDD